MLYLEGPIGSGKTTRLLAETTRLLDSVPASSVLVLCSNHARQQKFIEALLTGRNTPLAQLPVYTFAGFVRNTLFNYWPLVEAEIVSTLKQGSPRLRPELSGLEDTELMLKWLLARLRKEAAEKGQAVFQDFPGTDQHIIKQIVRRLRLRSENQLSRPEMLQRSELLDEMCRTETAWLERQFDVESYRLRVLDPNKQLDIFNNLIQKDNALSGWLTGSIKHLVVDDVDETIVAQQRLVEFLAPTLESLMLAADIDGGSRRGYLNAYPYDWQALKALRPGETVTLARQDNTYQAGQALLANWKQPDGFAPLPPVVQTHDGAITRVEMLEQVVDDVLGLLETGYQPGDLCLVLPKTDFLSFYQLQSRLSQRGIPVQLISGTKRPSDNPRCRAFLCLMQWANSTRWKIRLSAWEIKTVLMQVLKLNQVPGMDGEPLDALVQAVATQQAQTLQEQLSLLATDALPDDLPAQAVARYRQLVQWLEKAGNLPFDQQLYSAFSELLTGFSTEQDGYGDLNRIIQSYLRQLEIYQGFQQSADVLDVENTEEFNRWWLAQAKSGSVADTPEMPEAIHPEALVIGTPQKVIDNELYRKVQFWLDVGSREWARSDNAPLYNAWVHSAVWDGSAAAFSEEFNEAVIRTRAGHITRTLMLLATAQVRAYASELDDLGFTQAGLLKPRLLTEPVAESSGELERAMLRPDQAPVLQYERGTMAISAVPGAGKTFVNVELLLELIQRGVAPERILVLTYMDSAAKTLLGRLKKKLAGVTHQLPVVSTIHSLAFRILTENDHALLMGYLPDDMTILDDYGRGDVLARVAALTQPESAKSVQEWVRGIDRGINHAKMAGVSPAMIEAQLAAQPENFRLAEFLPAYKLYEQELHQNGFLDFTDLITKAVGILHAFPDIRQKYQTQFAYIVEDEAQDSSRILQEFIRLLGGEQPNLIRTGDTNQSITTTFSSADTAVFRDFVKAADHRVRMNHSGRCAPEIIELANFWLTRAGELPELENAFEPVAMLPVKGKNPNLLAPLSAREFDLDGMEGEWLVGRIREIRAAQPEASVAVLVRSNAQVNKITALLHQAQVPAVSLSEQLNINPVFQLILCYLRLLADPADLALQSRWYQCMVEAHLVEDTESLRTFIQTAPLFYQSPLDLADETLKQWYYDWLDLSRQAAGGNISALIARMTDQFFLSVADRSNGYLCALMAQDILSGAEQLEHLSPLEIVIHQFEAFQKSWRGKKSFTDVLLNQPHQVVQVMSMHKSKGQEFDVVFMPYLQMDSFPHETASIRFDEADRLMQELDGLTAKAAGHELPPTYQADKKREKIEEEARLIYVGLTRAKRALYLSAHRKATTRYNRLRTVQPAMAFQVLSDKLNPEATPSDNVVPLKETRHVQTP